MLQSSCGNYSVTWIGVGRHSPIICGEGSWYSSNSKRHVTIDRDNYERTHRICQDVADNLQFLRSDAV